MMSLSTNVRTSLRLFKRAYQRLGDPVFYEKRFGVMRRKLQRITSGEPPPPGRFALDQLPASPRVTLVVAHPDDEIFCSGTLCELASRGASIEVISLTRGEGGPTGGYCRSALGRVREVEMQKSCALLGARQVHFLDYIDPVAMEFRAFAPEVSVEELTIRLTAFFAVQRPDLILTHGSNGEYWHPAHLLVHRAVLAAAKSNASNTRSLHVATFNAWQEGHALDSLFNIDDQPNLLVDVTPWHKKRLAAFKSHTSQLAWFGTTTGESPDEFIKITPLEALLVRKFLAMVSFAAHLMPEVC